ncbi:MAG: enoyl-CoA hydratase-related protein [Myxococcota bacterium]|nr:enoyl-CoA hydratase-related protein [Myxococcota bacterium]
MSVLMTEREGHVATLTLHRPEKLNALDAELLVALHDAMRELGGGDRGGADVRCVVLTGSGDKAFAAGADIAAMAEMSPTQAKRFADLAHVVGAAIEQATFPVIAAVNGFALGGGCELALCADFIYASDKARFGQPEVNLGVMPGFGGTQRLSRRVGAARARELCMTGDLIGAEEALRLGLVNAVVPHAELLPRARAVAKTIAAKGPLAVAAIKRTILRGLDAPLPTANELEATAFAALFGTRDQREGMKAFLEKRPTVFEGK